MFPAASMMDPSGSQSPGDDDQALRLQLKRR
jgi:hypothetical protein